MRVTSRHRSFYTPENEKKRKKDSAGYDFFFNAPFQEVQQGEIKKDFFQRGCHHHALTEKIRARRVASGPDSALEDRSRERRVRGDGGARNPLASPRFLFYSFFFATARPMK